MAKASTAKKKTVKKRTTKKKATTKEKVSTATKNETCTKRRKKLIPRVLCFTTSYKRPYYLYNTINNVLNQKYTNIVYSIGICVDNAQEKEQYKYLLNDFIKDKRLKIFFHTNSDQHENYLYPIKSIEHANYNLFIKIDDDDIYKQSYISDVVAAYETYNCDIVSSTTHCQINNDEIEKGEFKSIGEWQPDLKSDIKFGMPCTYAFNNKALSILLNISKKEWQSIHPFEDPCWRTKWREGNLKSYVINKSDSIIYNIHGKNTASSYLYRSSKKKDVICVENDFFILCLFEHNYWSSLIYLNKRNNRMYNIDNDDHGAFELINGAIKINWDDWGEEIFYKKNNTDNSYYYSVQK